VIDFYPLLLKNKADEQSERDDRTGPLPMVGKHRKLKALLMTKREKELMGDRIKRELLLCLKFIPNGNDESLLSLYTVYLCFNNNPDSFRSEFC